MFAYRMIANTDTVTQIGLLTFNPKEQKSFFERLNSTSRPRFGTPYVFPVSTILKSDTPTRETFIAFHLPKVMRGIAAEISTWKDMSVYDGIRRIIPLFRFQHEFLWTEVLIDVAYQYPERIDLFARFPIGPGSLPTMQRLGGAQESSEFVATLAGHRLDGGVSYNGIPLRLSAENWEGIGCEFRKYTNLKNGMGRKRLYRENP